MKNGKEVNQYPDLGIENQKTETDTNTNTKTKTEWTMQCNVVIVYPFMNAWLIGRIVEKK